VATIVSYQLILNLHRLGALGTLIFFAVVRPVMIFRFYNFGVVAVAARRQEEKEQESV
jgi:hypothetical protein